MRGKWVILLTGVMAAGCLAGCSPLNTVVEALPDLSESISNTMEIMDMPNLKNIGNMSLEKEEGTSIFNELTVSDEPGISADADCWLYGDIAEFMKITVKEDTQAVVRYTYTTDDEGNLELGVYPKNNDEVTYFTLKKATDEAYGTIWAEKEITLEAGENIFYISGRDIPCKIRVEVTGIDPDLTEDVSAFLLPDEI